MLFSVKDSYDLNDTIEIYRWDFGDGSTKEGGNASHSYLSYGVIYSVKLTVIDNDGEKG